MISKVEKLKKANYEKIKEFSVQEYYELIDKSNEYLRHTSVDVKALENINKEESALFSECQDQLNKHKNDHLKDVLCDVDCSDFYWFNYDKRFKFYPNDLGIFTYEQSRTLNVKKSFTHEDIHHLSIHDGSNDFITA